LPAALAGVAGGVEEPGFSAQPTQSQSRDTHA
jgi:hypothetical protein